MKHKQGVKGPCRIVPEHVRTPSELGSKNIPVLKKLLRCHNGLILITGPVGAGKTTTLNSLIDELDRTGDDPVVTIEAPIEFLQQNQFLQSHPAPSMAAAATA
jgi:twitching motility protein PilT